MTDTLVVPDVDIEEMLDPQLPCKGVNRCECPNEVAWRLTLACCGCSHFICEACHRTLLECIGRGDRINCGVCKTCPAAISNLVRV